MFIGDGHGVAGVRSQLQRPDIYNKFEGTGMKLFSNSRAVLGGLALSASLAVFSSGASAAVIPICSLVGNSCGDTVDFVGVVGGQWSLEFESPDVLSVPASVLSLSFTLASADFGEDSILASAPSLTLDSVPLSAPDLTLDDTSFNFLGTDAGISSYQFIATWDVHNSIEINDFHLACTSLVLVTDACDGWFVTEYLFNWTPADEGGNTVPAPAAAPLLLLGLAVTTLGAAMRRRRPLLESAAA